MSQSAVRASVLTTDGSEDEGLAAEAKEVIDRYLQPGLGAERSVEAYDSSSDKYDQYVQVIKYTGPVQIAKTMRELYPEQSQREKVQILDVAAGTGLAGVEMKKVGFQHLDALDPSQGMLDVAVKRGVYRRLFKHYIDHNKLPIEDNAYDAITICGGMGENQIPCSALHEMIRLVKPGGNIVNVTRVEHLHNCTEYIGRLEKLMEQLEQEGRWRQIVRDTFPNFVKGKDGLLLVHQVL